MTDMTQAQSTEEEVIDLQPMKDGELAPVRGVTADPDENTLPEGEQFFYGGVPVAPMGADGLPAFVTPQLVQQKIVDEVCTVIPGTGAAIVNLILPSGMSVQGTSNFTAAELAADPEGQESAEAKAIDAARANALNKLMEIESYVLADYRYQYSLQRAQESAQQEPVAAQEPAVPVKAE